MLLPLTSPCFNRGNHHQRVARILPQHTRALLLIAIAPVSLLRAPLPIQTLHLQVKHSSFGTPSQ